MRDEIHGVKRRVNPKTTADPRAASKARRLRELAADMDSKVAALQAEIDAERVMNLMQASVLTKIVGDSPERSGT